MTGPEPVVAPVALVSLFCADHVALADWYRRTFGYTEMVELTSPLFVALDAGAVALGFHHDDAYDLLDLADRRHPTGTRMHLTLDLGSAAAVDRARPLVVEHGATVLKEPFTTYYGARQLVVADPEGNVVRLSSTQTALAQVATHRPPP